LVFEGLRPINTILQSPCGYVGDLCEALALIVLVECCICSGQVYSLTVMAPVIEQNPKNSFAAASDFQDMFLILAGCNRCSFQFTADRAGDGGSTVIVNMALNSLHGRSWVDCRISGKNA